MSDPVRKRVTVRDVAAAANVSKSLVSAVYSNPTRVSETSRKLVLDTAQALGFRPNWAARTLTSEHGGFIGILMADLHESAFADLVDAARHELRQNDRTALMTSVNSFETSISTLDALTIEFFNDLRPSHLLLVGSVRDMESIRPIMEQVPTVLAGGIGNSLPLASTVRTDDSQGMTLLVEHLRSLGHERIAHIGGGGGPVGEVRLDAYCRAMTHAGLEKHIMIEHSDFTEQGGREAFSRLLYHPEPPSAVVSINDVAAVGALAASQRTHRVAITGYGNSPLAKYEFIDLTTIDPRNDKIGQKSVHKLLSTESNHSTENHEILIPPELVVRSSSQL